MTLLMVEPWDRYASANGTLPKITDNWTISGTATANDPQNNGRFGGKVLRIWNPVVSVTVRRDLGANYTTLCMGFAYIMPTTIGNVLSHPYLELCRFYDSAAAAQVDLVVDLAGNLLVVRGSTVIATGNRKKRLKNGAWHYIEFKAFVSDTVGTAEAWIDGTKVIDANNLDTKNTANTDFRWVGFPPNGGQQDPAYYDDVYVTDGNRLGDLRMTNLLPTADTADKDFVPNAGGTNYTQVDEVVPDLDTTFVQGSTVGDLDFFTSQDAPATMDSIVAFCPWVYAKKTDATARTLKPKVRSGASIGDGDNLTLTTTYAYSLKIMETDPQGGGAWTSARVNAAEVGVEVTS